MAFNDTSNECGLLVNAIKQLTQSVNVVVSVSVMCPKYSRTIFSTVSKARRTTWGCSSCAAVVNTINMDFHPDLTFATRARIIWETHLCGVALGICIGLCICMGWCREGCCGEVGGSGGGVNHKQPHPHTTTTQLPHNYHTQQPQNTTHPLPYYQLPNLHTL